MSSSVSIHGRNHRIGGVDPIPGLERFIQASGSYEERVLAEPSLSGYWPLDDAGEPALDHSTSGHDLTERFGSPSYEQPGPFPDVPAATSIGFNSASSTSSGGVSLWDEAGPTDPFHFQDLDPYTFEILVNPSAFDTSGADGIIGLNDGVTGSIDGLYLRLNSSGHIVMNRAGLTFTSTETLSIGDWTHVAMTYDGATLRLYLDGEEVQANATATNHFHSGEVQLALHYNGTRYSRFLGRLAQAAIYSEALDAATIASHATAFTGGGGSTAPPSAPTGSAGGVLDGSYPNPGLASSVAGAGLTETGDVLSVNPDGSTLEISSDTLRVKADGITGNEIAAGAVGASELAATAVTPASYGDATHVAQFTVDADGRITSAASVAIPTPVSDPADDAAVWLPLSTVVAGAPELVWGADDSLIPTLTPLA